MLQTAVGGGCGSDPRFHSWGWVFTIGKEKPNKPAVNNVAQQVISISVEASTASNEVCGSVQQLFKTKTHHGIIIQLHGIVQITRSANAGKCQLLAPSINKSEKKYKSPAVYQVLCGSENGGTTLVQTKPYQKFPFRLKLPEQTLLPPTLFSGLVQVEYKLVVKMIVNGNFTTLGSTIISNNGQLPLCRMVGIKGESVIEKQIKVGGMVAVLEIPKKEFLLKEDIPFAIKCMEQQNLIKLITVSLLKIITCEMKKEKMKEVQVLDSISFKRFLKRREFQRVGKFKCGKNPRCATYFGSDSIKLKITYAIEVKISTESGPICEQMEIIVGTESNNSPSAPFQKGDLERVPSAPVRSLVGSLLSLTLLPPSYSQLSSRAESIMSLETLPPNYDDALSASIDEED